MPTYDYRCSACNHEFEEFQPISASPLVSCPNCSKPALKRIMRGGAGMIFKGQGFYLTDYKKGGNGKAAGSPKKKPPTKDGTGPADSTSPPSPESPKDKNH